MEEAAENGKESSHSAHADGMNERINYIIVMLIIFFQSGNTSRFH
jgi:hypothetical protein